MSPGRDVGRTLRRLATVVHRDLGYLLSALLLGYCLSGLALNHVDDWNPDFVVDRRTVALPPGIPRETVDASALRRMADAVGEADIRVSDFPSSDQVKLYFKDSTLLVRLSTGVGEYERVTRRPVFFEANLLHRNAVEGWRWVSDGFALALITLNATGLVMLRGPQGFGGRGKWLLLLGVGPPALALLIGATGT